MQACSCNRCDGLLKPRRTLASAFPLAGIRVVHPLMQRGAYASNAGPSDGYENRGKDNDEAQASSSKAVRPDDAMREIGSRSWSRSLQNITSLVRSLIASLVSWVWSCREILPAFYSPSPSQAIQRCFIVLAATLLLCFIISGIDISLVKLSEHFRMLKNSQ